MKRVYVAIAFLLMSISLCCFEQYTVHTTYKETTAYIDKAIEYTNKQDYKKAEESCNQLYNYWTKKYPYLSAVTDHELLDDAGITINSLKELSENESEDLESTLITAKNQMKSLHENQEISFGNIF